MTATTFDPNNKSSSAQLLDDTSGTTAPTLVQRAQTRYTASASGTVTVTLGSSPTVGNTLVAMVVGYPGSASSTPFNAQAGWVLQYQDFGSSQNFQGGAIYTRTVQAGDGTGWTFSLNNGPANAAVFEFSGLSKVGAFSGAGAASTTTLTVTPFLLANTYQAIFIEHDALSTYSSFTGPATLLFDGSGGGVNHPAVLYQITGSTNVVTTFSATVSLPFYIGFSAEGAGYVANGAVKSTALATAAATRTMTGPTYFEVTATTLTGTLSIGFVNRSYNMASGTILGTDNNGLGFKSSGAVVLNNVTLSTIQTYVQGDVVCVAVDIANRLVWFRTNGGNWNNSGAANPATGVGGIDYSTMSLGALFPAIGCSITGAVLTGKFTSGFAQTAPTGFITADTCAATARNSAVGVGASYSTIGGGTNHAVVTVIAARASWLGLGRNYRTFTPAGAIKSVAGQVQESGTPTAGKKVYLYDHNSGELLGTATSDGSGNFSIPALGRAKTLGVALDDPTYNALVYDAVVPV